MATKKSMPQPEPLPEPIPDPEPEPEPPPKLELKSEVDTKLEKIDLSKDRHASGQRLLELKAGRHVDDIPRDDEYWKAMRKHQVAFNK